MHIVKTFSRSVSFNQSKTKKTAISRKHHQNFSPVLMNGDELETSTSFTHLGLSLSSNLTWKTHIHSFAKHESQKLGFLARASEFFSSFHLLSIYIQVPHPPFFRVLLPCLGRSSKIHSLSSDKIQSKAIRLTNNHNLTKSLQVLSPRRLVGGLSIFYRYLPGHCYHEIRDIIPIPLRRVRITRSSTHPRPFQVSLPNPRTLSHKSSFIPRSCNSWNVLPSSCFPEFYNLPSFKSKINKLHLISITS